MAYHPIKIACCMFFFILIVVIIATATGVNSISEASEYDWVIASTSESKNLDAFDDAKNQVDLVTSTVLERSQELDNKFHYIFESSDGSDIYTPANLLHMCRVESSMLDAGGFEDVCVLKADGNCTLPTTSIVVYFYDFEHVNDWNCTLLGSSHVINKKQPIYNGLNSLAGQEEYGTWLSSNAVELGYSTMCNSYWSFGTPLPGFASDVDREFEQFEVYQKFLAALDGSVDGVEGELFEEFDIDDNADGVFAYYPTPYMSEAEVSTLRVYWYSEFNIQNELIRLLESDLFFAIFSILFVVFWLRIHTGSTLIALSGIFMIVTSLPFTILIYKKVFNIPFYSELHSLVLFIVLGVGADDIFVLNDSWKLTHHLYTADITNGRNRKTIHRRLYKCYRHTMSTVFNTSFTTSMAFLATGLSPLMPIATFGWFAATCITCNFVFVITLMPPVVILSEIYFENSCIPCQEKKEKKSMSSSAASDPIASEVAVSKTEANYDRVSSSTEKEDHTSSPGVELTTVAAGNGRGAVVLGGEDEHLDDDAVDNNESPHTDNAKVSGVSDVTRAKIASDNTSAPTGLGTVLLNAYINAMEFSLDIRGFKLRILSIFIMLGLFAYGIVGIIYGLQLEPPTSQETWFPEGHMLEESQILITDGFLGFDDSSYEAISINLGISGIDRSGFNRYIPDKNRGDAKFDDGFDFSAPACQQAVVRMCEDIPEFACNAGACKPTSLIARQNSTRCFMTEFREWSFSTLGEDTYAMNSTYFYKKLKQFRIETVEWQDDIGFIGGELKYITVSFTSTMESEEPMQRKMDVQDNINDIMGVISNYDECNTCDCGSLRYSSPYAFLWMRSEIGLVEGFYQGMYIAFPVAFCVLLFATGNLFISFYAILSVLFIVFGVLGFVNYSLGWDLGVAESIAGIIIIGFSVDYTVHLGHMYTDAEKQLGLRDRVSKFEHASREIVPTVVGGAITTAGAGCFMFLCQLMFFVKMAALIVSTILLSYLYSLGFFMSLLLVMGPEDDQGKLSVYFEWIKSKINDAGRSGEIKVAAEPTTSIEMGEAADEKSN
eukprot:CAMPEP_0114464258 /NCGR_PEP_ID=MMETSP0104-20121206/7824_1 /TAXON_ID=37642 ORGANISM="Paraphysomonas imperforata, Strain PA2" /NCGR_SAMPLE_ID=MMETSP0104 /ASSEMBLY_ACC=CAM_ASM_000202 /LENGTH=1058 /DNA_ID=CAMNT_0001637307 /DNA_START=211 /DNA_END=3387 /DNA_ORIENTATION=-